MQNGEDSMQGRSTAILLCVESKAAHCYVFGGDDVGDLIQKLDV